MSSSTTLLDTISSTQASKEVTANAMFDAASQVMIFGKRASTTTALTWGFYGGRMLVDGVLTAIANGSIALTASLTNYVEVTRAGVVSKNTTAFTPGSIPLYTITAGASTVTSYIDERSPIDPRFINHNATFAVTVADVTMTAAQARSRIITTTGALTAARSVIVPDNGEWTFKNSCTGAFNLTVKTAAGAGVVVMRTRTVQLIADGTNVIEIHNFSGYTVATLPAAGIAGRTAYVTDATAPTYRAALTGGGAVVCGVFDTGAAWVSV